MTLRRDNDSRIKAAARVLEAQMLDGGDLIEGDHEAIRQDARDTASVVLEAADKAVPVCENCAAEVDSQVARAERAEAAARDFADALTAIRNGELVTRGAVTYMHPGGEFASDALARHPEFSEGTSE